MLKPNSTVYLCADTGMDWNNSIWWDKYAYQSGPRELQGYWHNVKGLWFKAHACCEGFWYLEMISHNKGFVKVGRTPLNNNSIPQGEAGLHSQVDDDKALAVPFADILLGRCDYIYYTTGYNNDASRQYFGFITDIETLNFDTAIVRFTLDAIQTYGEYFNFGPSLVQRDMQHQEKAFNGVPVRKNMNFQPEPMVPSVNEYVFQRITGPDEIFESSNLGRYDKMFCMSDVSLKTSDITPNPYYGGLPSFKVSDASYEEGVSLGIGGYYIPKRANPVFDLLGSYNAVEHLLYTWLVPSKLCDNLAAAGSDPLFIGNFSSMLADVHKGNKDMTLKVPTKFNDEANIETSGGDYKPVNLKCYYAPLSYVSIADGQGGSMEIELQSLDEYEQSEENFFNLDILMHLSTAPNTGSCLYVKNKTDMEGGLYSPMVTLWQMPSYSMTPNNSGYNNQYVEAASLRGSSMKYVAVGAGLGVANGLITTLSAAGGPITAALGSEVGNLAGRVGGSSVNQGVSNLIHSFETERKAEINETFGLPKAVGGFAQGFTRFNMNHVGYYYFFVHQRTEIIKIADLLFSIYGYSQNAFRYPNINTRRRWTYVQCPDVNIIDKGHKSAVPLWARQQIKQRMSAGITFWNVRWALLGDGDEDTDPRGITSYDAPEIQKNKGHRFVRNYGDLETLDYVKENESVVGGYCPNYTPNTEGLLEPD